MKKITIYISYHRSDFGYASSLISHLSPLVRTRGVELLFQTSATAGESWDINNKESIDKADIILLLISPDFINSDIIYNQELNIVLKNKSEFILPIILRPTDWYSIDWMRKRQILPKGGIPISQVESQDEIYLEIVKEISLFVDNIAVTQSTSITKKKQNNNKKNEKSIFISHDHDDGDFAELLKLKLERNGFNAWIDTERLKIGQDWREEIDMAIFNSNAFIVIMSPKARKSEYVTYEWAFA